MKELHLEPSWDQNDFICELTKEMDKHLLKESKYEGMQTYLYDINTEDNAVVIRYPGATRGHIEFDNDKVITGIVLYETVFKNMVACYKESVKDVLKQFIGYKFISQ